MDEWMDGFSFVYLCVCNLVCGLVLVDIEPKALVEQVRIMYTCVPSVLHFCAFHLFGEDC